MMQELTKEIFEQSLNQSFFLHLSEEQVLEMELVEVEGIAPHEPPKSPKWGAAPKVSVRPHPFSLVFRGPHTPPLNQQMYKLTNEIVGTIESMFLVPISADEQGRYYEAVFN